MAREVELRRGHFTISIDLEILWGVWDSPAKPVERRCAELERTITPRLLELFRKFDIRVTWAIVGRLLDDSRGFDGLRGGRDCWYAPDLIDAIRGDRVDHEIGSHSYGHVYFNDIPPASAVEDLQRAAEIHRAHGLSFTSFVFPRNGIGHLEALRDAGVRVYRSIDAGVVGWAATRAPSLRAAVNLADKALALPPPIVRPILHDNGLVELPSSMLLMSRTGLRRVVHPRALERKLRDGLHRAARQRGIFHLWFHPSNFYDDMDGQFGVLERGLEEASALRERGDLDVSTMGDFADRVEAA